MVDLLRNIGGTLISSQVPFDMELCLRRRLSGGRWTAVDKSSPDWR